MKDYINDVIRPKVQADGGEVSLVSYENNILTLMLQGECSKCAISQSCLPDWIQKEIERDKGISPQIKFIVKKPYFWDI